jgi:hypothetical protein
MAPDKAPHGQLVATGPVAQCRLGMSLIVYPTKEDYEQITALAEKGQTGTFDGVPADHNYSDMDFRAGAGRQRLGRR